MRNEHEQNLNLLRGLLHMHEEGASEALNDGTNGDEPWSEADRRASQEMANWIRSTFFAPPVPTSRGKPSLRRLRSETLCTDDEIWAELESTDPLRRESAVAAIDALANLASLRARLRGTSFLVERHAVYDYDLLRADMRSNNDELRDAAVNVWDDVTHVMALAGADEVELTEAEREWARDLCARVHAQLDEMRRAAEREEEAAP